MNILFLHNYYKIRGGEEEVFHSEIDLLRRKGHKVFTYTLDNSDIELEGKLAKALSSIWNRRVYQEILNLITDESIDIAHFHNTFPLISPSGYYAAKDADVPVVQTLHNYRLLCPNALFFRNGKVCEDCLGKPFPYPGILHGCYRNDRLTTATVASVVSLHGLANTWKNKIDAYIALTEFAKQKFIDGGLPSSKIFVKPNFVSSTLRTGSGQGGFALYVGRLSVEKGIDTLLEAWKTLGSKIGLKIVGDGPLADEVTKVAKEFPGVEWLGRRPLSDVYSLMGEASFLVFPSKWYETFGRVIIEAFAQGTPVIGSRVGCIETLIDVDITGKLFEVGNSESLITSVVDFLNTPKERRLAMRDAARFEFEHKYTDEINYTHLYSIYQQLLDNSK